MSSRVSGVGPSSGAKTILLRALLAPFFVAGGLWVHEFIQVQAHPRLIVDNFLERAIPFLPWTIWIYFSFFLFVAYTVIRVESHLFRQFVRSVVLASIVAWSIVLIMPISFVRPDPALIDSVLYRRVFTFVYEADPSHITFPSLHVAVTWICCLLLRNRPGRWRRILLGVGISLSTLFVKQHLISDVIGGVILAWTCVWLIENNYFLFRRRRKEHATNR